ncbi:DUF417 family protein [Pelagibaculum spongiae]|uniref:DUF417 domain-containing protein n=1 Tax=Pelagibaculum spongiae TaxID=2080658 RepID=A0A2V1GRN2_9GAMM|nr:DUF417 family protein [Pelagibaculum spongiae]PVZ63427.1 hypothetical protein DC094_21195 [Pelagibaculum spongiae]
MNNEVSTIERAINFRPSDSKLMIYLSAVTALYLIWVGLLKLSPPEHQQIEFWLGNSPLFDGLLTTIGTPTIGVLMALFEVPAGLLILLGLNNRKLGIIGCLMAMAIFALNFLYLFTNPVWVDALGGFPIIGSGQNLLKYLSMFAVPAYILSQYLQEKENCSNALLVRKLAIFCCFAGIVLVMGWIGWMKFYEFEAKGIVRLMEPNIFFNWTYAIWSVQGASNFIGIVEWAFLALLLCLPFNRLLGTLGVIGIALTAFGTLTFMFSTPGWNPDSFFPLLNRTGVFVLKDQLLLAAAIILWREY